MLETVGRALREMKSATEKLITLEVALVRLTKPELDATYEALDERLTRLERSPVRAAAESETTAPRRPIGTVAASEAPALAPPPSPISGAPGPGSGAGPEKNGDGAAPAGTPPLAPIDLEEFRTRFAQRVVPRTSRSAQLLLRASRVVSLDGVLVTIALASEEMRQNSELISQGLKGALEHEFRRTFTVRFNVDPSVAASPSPAAVPSPPEPYDVEGEVETADDAVTVVDSVGEHLIAEMFPGAQEIE